MNTFFKKYFWTVKLAGIALLAFVSAGLVNDFIAGKLFAMPNARLGKPAAGAGAPIDTELGRVAESANAAQELVLRRVFRLEEPPPPVVAETPDPDEKKPDLTASGELVASALPINLVGTFVAALPDFSYATLQIEGENKIAATGSEYLDGKARVVKIAPGHIVLKEDTRYTYVRLWTKDVAAKGGAQHPVGPGPASGMPRGRPNPMAPPATLNPMVPAGGRSADVGDVAQGVTKTGAYDYTLDRKTLDKQLADLPKLQAEARVVPHYKDNQYQGFKLVGVRPGSLYRAIGIRSGDVITAVNGNKIDSPNKALELFEQLKSSSQISVEIERRGQPKTLGYTIQ